jgi:membrane-associated phospholipid phosphatase
MTEEVVHRPAWKTVFSSKIFYASAFLLIIGAALDNINGAQIQRLFPGRLPIPDTLFQFLPYWRWTQILTDLANIFSCLLLALYLFPNRWHKLPQVLAVLGLGYTIRSITILLNPFGGPLGNVVHYGLTNIHQYGQFPSGHVFLVTAIYYLIDRRQLPRYKQLALLSVFVELISLLLSRGHYSIDIIGGLLLGYFSFHFLADYQELTLTKR